MGGSRRVVALKVGSMENKVSLIGAAGYIPVYSMGKDTTPRRKNNGAAIFTVYIKHAVHRAAGLFEIIGRTLSYGFYSTDTRTQFNPPTKKTATRTNEPQDAPTSSGIQV